MNFAVSAILLTSLFTISATALEHDLESEPQKYFERVLAASGPEELGELLSVVFGESFGATHLWHRTPYYDRWLKGLGLEKIYDSRMPSWKRVELLSRASYGLQMQMSDRWEGGLYNRYPEIGVELAAARQYRLEVESLEEILPGEIERIRADTRALYSRGEAIADGVFVNGLIALIATYSLSDGDIMRSLGVGAAGALVGVAAGYVWFDVLDKLGPKIFEIGNRITVKFRQAINRGRALELLSFKSRHLLQDFVLRPLTRLVLNRANVAVREVALYASRSPRLADSAERVASSLERFKSSRLGCAGFF